MHVTHRKHHFSLPTYPLKYFYNLHSLANVPGEHDLQWSEVDTELTDIASRPTRISLRIIRTNLRVKSHNDNADIHTSNKLNYNKISNIIIK